MANAISASKALSVLEDRLHFLFECDPNVVVPGFRNKDAAIGIEAVRQLTVETSGVNSRRTKIKQNALTVNFPAARRLGLMKNAASDMSVEIPRMASEIPEVVASVKEGVKRATAPASEVRVG